MSSYSFSKKILSPSIRTIGLVVPMGEELRPIMSALFPLQTFTFPYAGGIYLTPLSPSQAETTHFFVVCLQCGIGKAAAAGAVAWLSARYSLDLCIHFGTAGSLSSTLEPRDWVLAESVGYHDVDLTGFGYARGVFPNNPLFSEKSLNHLHHPNFYPLFQKYFNAEPRCHKGQIVSGDQFVCNLHIKQDIQTAFPNAVAIDMESAAFAQACQTHQLPWLIFRTISDNAESQEDEQYFKKNLTPCAKAFSHIFFKTLQVLTYL